MATRLRSFAKINLGLAVGPLRADGFHGLTTMYQTIGLHDVVSVSARPAAATRITLTVNHPGVPCTKRGDAEKNTAYVMAAGALERMGVAAEVEIDIEKKLPVQGGMGAGSANAAAALIGLERELGRALRGAERLRLAAEVGSDVPLFLVGGTVLGLGRGEEVSPMPDLPRAWCVVAVPNVGVSTKLAFAELDRREGIGHRAEGRGGEGSRQKVPYGDIKTDGTGLSTAAQADGPMPYALCPTPSSSLTFPQEADRLKELSRVLASIWVPDGVQRGPSGITRPGQDQGIQGDLAERPGPPANLFDGVMNPLLALVRTGIENDFEEVAFSQHPSLRSTKRDLQGSGLAPGQGSAIFACLSGSGSALFGLYANEADARAAQRRVLESGTEAVVTETLPRQAYWDTMFAE